MKLIRGGALFIGLLGVAGATQAAVTSTWTATNDYDFRGITQTAHDPALQASLDYAHESGFYAGAWFSNIDFGTDQSSTTGDPKLETDFYGGLKKSITKELGYDVGAVYYTYHVGGGRDFNYLEIYGGLTYNWLSGKLFYSPKFGGNAAEDFLGSSISGWYMSGDVAYPLPQNFQLLAHAGYSFGDYWDKLKKVDAGDSYFDYNLGVGYTAGKFSLALKWIDGSDLKANDTNNLVPGHKDVFSSKSRVIFSVATTFPWAESK
jgi:uncharacterized protein (TIGR02001 family)